MLQNHSPIVSIIIKALNEEESIAATLESALAVLGGIDGEIILADGGSSDRTVEIAGRYPVRIVQLTRREDRSCGSGAQLGYQYSRGRYLCLVDADMILHRPFLSAAITYLDANPDVAGVGGEVIECEVANLEFEQRNRRFDPSRCAGVVTRLNGSGVYRRSAVERIGYLTDRNLHGAEELDLAARLRAEGYALVRLDLPAVDHHGHVDNAYLLLLRRVVTRNAWATGEIARAAIGRRHFWSVVAEDNNSFLCLLVIGWWLAMAVAPFFLPGAVAPWVVALVFLCPFAAMALRWRSIRLSLYSVAAWNVYALCFLPGFVRRRSAPSAWLDSVVLKDELPIDDGRSVLPARRAVSSCP